MKQSHNYDCGHVCMIDHGYSPPPIARPLSGKVIADCIPNAKFQLLLDFDADGIYMFTQGLNGDPNGAHWVSYRAGRVLDPSDGHSYSPCVLKERYNTVNFRLVGAVILGVN